MVVPVINLIPFINATGKKCFFKVFVLKGITFVLLVNADLGG